MPLSTGTDGSVSLFRENLDAGKPLSEIDIPAPDAKDASGKTALWYAIGTGRPDVVKTLIDSGHHVDSGLLRNVQPNRRDAACILETLIDNGARPYDTSLFHIMAYPDEDVEDCLKVMIRKGLDVNAPLTTRNGHETRLAHVLANGGMERCLSTLLVETSGSKDALYVGFFMIDAKDGRGMTPLHEAARAGKNGCAKILMDAGASVNAMDMTGRTALHLALDPAFDDGRSQTGPGHTDVDLSFFRRDMIRGLLKRGAVPDIRDKNGETPLHMAMKVDFFDGTVELMLENSTDPDMTDDEGKTPLHIAASRGESGYVDSLLKNGACVMMKDLEGRTTLHHAVRGARFSGNMEVIETLVEAGAVIGARDDRGRTPLHLAASEEAVLHRISDVTYTLMKAGADPDREDEDGRTPMDIFSCNPELLDLVTKMANGRMDVSETGIPGYS